jgi:hypothetical protein
MNFTNIKKHLEIILNKFTNIDQNIINNYQIILKILVVQERIDIIFLENKIDDDTIFDSINDLKIIVNLELQNELDKIILILQDKDIFINNESYISSYSISTSSNGSDISTDIFSHLLIEDQIKVMLETDSKILNEILEPNNSNVNDLKDEYGNITTDMINDAKILFDVLDINKDSVITPSDIHNTYLLVESNDRPFNCNIIMSMVRYFITYKKSVDFKTFVINFAYI